MLRVSLFFTGTMLVFSNGVFSHNRVDFFDAPLIENICEWHSFKNAWPLHEKRHR